MATPEGVVLAEVIAFCSKVPGLRLSRNTSGGTKSATTGRWFQYGLFHNEGGSDLIGWYTISTEKWEYDWGVSIPPKAIIVAIEVKSPKGKTKPELLAKQKQFIADVRAAGGIAGIVHSVEECAALLGVEVR